LTGTSRTSLRRRTFPAGTGAAATCMKTTIKGE